MPKRLIVIGGGFAGSKIAKKLQNSFHVTLIDRKNYFEFTPGILKSIVYPNKVDNIQILHKNYLRNSNVIVESVKKINDSEVILENNKKLEYDLLVIASGSRYNKPIKDMLAVSSVRKEEISKYHEKLKDSGSVLIVGGGIVGVEIAAEIVSRYRKKIVLVHSYSRLIRRNSREASRYARKFLERKGVKLMLGERFVSEKEGYFMTDRGNSLKSDMIILCTGITPNSEFVDSKFLDDKGFVSVDENLKVRDNWFCCGDTAAIDEEKTAQGAEKQADTVIYNILNHEKMRKYAPQKRPVVISLGKYSGILEYKGLVITGMIPRIMKSIIELKTMISKKL